jgi:hypothetical protein
MAEIEKRSPVLWILSTKVLVGLPTIYRSRIKFQDKFSPASNKDNNPHFPGIFLLD